MKKTLLLILSVLLILSLAACGDGKEDGSGDNNGVESVSVEVTDENGKLTIDEAGVKALLSIYSDEALGLSADVNDYSFIITEVTIDGKLGCKAQAVIGDNKRSEGVFFIVGESCYKYDLTTKTYKLLTADGAVDANIKVEGETQAQVESTSSPFKTDEQVADENNDILKNRYKNYNLEKVGLPKDISEYEFQVTGNTAIAADGTTVYVVYLLENNEYTEFKFAVGESGDYYFDTKDNVYKHF